MTQQNIENDQIKGYYKQKDAFIRDIKTALSEKMERHYTCQQILRSK